LNNTENKGLVWASEEGWGFSGTQSKVNYIDKGAKERVKHFQHFAKRLLREKSSPILCQWRPLPKLSLADPKSNL
jgi:hypothetical protein